MPGLINLDFADVKTIMAGMGLAMMGTGVAEGKDRAIDAARRAISSPLLEGAAVTGARGVIINVTGGPDLSLVEVSEASLIVQEAADEDANIIFGAVVDPTLAGKVKITVIATGFGAPAARPAVSQSETPTPVDLSHYTEHARVRADAPTGVAAASRAERVVTPQRLSIARRSLLDLPMSASASGGSGANAAASVEPASAAAGAPAEASELEQEMALNSAFDVPAFLRRQEG